MSSSAPNVDGDGDGGGDAALYLMPIAMCVFISCILLLLSVFNTLYSVLTFPSSPTASQLVSKPLPTPSSRRLFLGKCCALLLLLLSFGLLNARIQGAAPPAPFDPYAVLDLGGAEDLADIKRQYRKLSLVHHPDKPTGSEAAFQEIGEFDWH